MPIYRTFSLNTYMLLLFLPITVFTFSATMSSADSKSPATTIIASKNVPKTSAKIVVDPAAPIPSSLEFKNGFFRCYSTVEMRPEAMSNIMKNVETRPTTLGEQMRANTFPEIIRDIMVRLSKMKSGVDKQLSRKTWYAFPACFYFTLFPLSFFCSPLLPLVYFTVQVKDENY